MQVQDLIKSSLRLIGVLGAGQTANTTEMNDSLEVFNALISHWNTQGIAIYTIAEKSFPLSANLGAYTIGTGGTLNAPRPVKIEAANIVQSNGLSSDLRLVGPQRWAEIAEKNLAGLQPLELYDDYDYPLSKISLWPKPSAIVNLDLFVWEEIAEGLTLVSVIDFPPGYYRAVRYNLAVDLAPEFGRQIDRTVAEIAQSSKAEIAQLNLLNGVISGVPPAPPNQPPQAQR